MAPLLTSAAALLLLGFAVDPTPKTATPRAYESTNTTIDEGEASCLSTTVDRKGTQAVIWLRNTCEIRVNYALCVHRSDDAKYTLAKGSLSPGAADDQRVVLSSAAKTFVHKANFCSGIMCVVTEPNC